MEAKGIGTLTKAKYIELEKDLLDDLDKEIVDKVLDKIKRILNFDPKVNTYEKLKIKLDKKREEGISTYEALNHKAYYDKNKKELNKRRYEAEKRKKLAEK